MKITRSANDSYYWKQYPLWLRALDFLANPYVQIAAYLLLILSWVVFGVQVYRDNR